MTGNKAVVAQQAIAVFKHGRLDLAWDCPFCGDHNEWSFFNLPPFAVFSDPILSFCHGCQKWYAIEVRQKLTGVVTPEMRQ